MADVDLPIRIRTRFEELGLNVADHQHTQLAAYFGLLTKWNRTINLTSVVLDPATDAAIDRLLVEPVLAARHAGAVDGLLIDLGSGGGSPAIPLKIALPGLKLLMIESRSRKAAFLREAARQLELTDTEVFDGRIEQATARPGFLGTARLVSIRAVRADSDLWDSVAGFLAPGGRVLWFKTSSDAPGPDLAPFAIEATYALGPTSELALLRHNVVEEGTEVAERSDGAREGGK